MNIKGTTRAQTIFLRSFHRNSSGPAPQDWPSPAILRRWLRRYQFRTALLRIRDTLTFQADFSLAAAASQAALRLADLGNNPLPHQDLRALTHLLRLAHAKRRFPVNAQRDLDLRTPASFELRDYVREQRGEDPDNDPDPMEALIEQMLKQNPGNQLAVATEVHDA